MASSPIGPAAGPRGRWRSWLLWALSAVSIAYSAWALVVVATSGTIGLTCVLGTIVRDEVPAAYEWRGAGRPAVKDELARIDSTKIRLYPDYVAAMRDLRDRVGQVVKVEWVDEDGRGGGRADATVRTRPASAYLWSFVWFLQEMGIFALGAYVYWLRPRDESARLFFGLCIVTVGAYMGGYHWGEIVVEPALIYGFAAFAALVPIVSLHFYLVFPRPNPAFVRHRRAALAVLYGVPAAFVGAIWWCMARGAYLRLDSSDAALPELARTIGWIKGLAIGYIGLSVAVFGLCIACLLASYRAAANRTERNQAYWILLASLFSIFPIGYLLWGAFWEPSRLGLSRTAWPMWVVSLLYTIAYALSIMRYKLAQVEEIFRRGKMYVLVSLAAGLAYPATLVVMTLAVNDQMSAEHTSRGAVIGALAIGLLILSGATRGPFQRAIDRRFDRDKTKFDDAMRRINLAVGSLVDRATLGARLLDAAAESLRPDWGAVYLIDDPGGPLRLAAWHGPEPDQATLAADNPLVERLRSASTLRAPQGLALGVGPASGGDPAADAMIALGGEVARSLEADGAMVGLMVLGPKRSGTAYRDEDVGILGALGSVAALALHSAGIQQTLERLNLELRDKVGKIAEQQRRILVLQKQLTGRGQPSAGPAADLDGADGPDEPSLAADRPDPAAFGAIRGSGRAIRRALAVVRKVAASPSAVLIRGESGTGKELLAQAIHAASPRADRPFVRVHCAALSQGLLESELFGHARGAYTGADRERVGRFEQADGGTLFLDEIGDINLEVQTKLLRVLQEKAFERVGSSHTLTVDVRVVAATHQDLEGLIRSGRFREDLFYRLNVIEVRAPSLRERKEDIFELAVHFLARHAGRNGRAIGHIEDDALEALTAHDWPGNVRELENAIERAVVLADGPALTLDDLPAEIRQPGRRPRRSLAIEPPGAAEADDPDDAVERSQLIDAMGRARGNKSEAARLMGLPRSTFFSKLKKHGLAVG